MRVTRLTPCPLREKYLPSSRNTPPFSSLLVRDVKPCTLLGIYRRFEGIYCLLYQGRIISRAKRVTSSQQSKSTTAKPQPWGNSNFTPSPTQFQMNEVHILIYLYFKMNFHIILPSTTRSFKYFIPFQIFRLKCFEYSLTSNTCYIFRTPQNAPKYINAHFLKTIIR